MGWIRGDATPAAQNFRTTRILSHGVDERKKGSAYPDRSKLKEKAQTTREDHGFHQTLVFSRTPPTPQVSATAPRLRLEDRASRFSGDFGKSIFIERTQVAAVMGFDKLAR